MKQEDCRPIFIIGLLVTYFENIFSPFISGFRPKNSCETVLIRMVENIKQCLDKGKIVCVLLMDLSRAFDCIPYKQINHLYLNCMHMGCQCLLVN